MQVGAIHPAGGLHGPRADGGVRIGLARGQRHQPVAGLGVPPLAQGEGRGRADLGSGITEGGEQPPRDDLPVLGPGHAAEGGDRPEADLQGLVPGQGEELPIGASGELAAIDCTELVEVLPALGRGRAAGRESQGEREGKEGLGGETHGSLPGVRVRAGPATRRPRGLRVAQPPRRRPPGRGSRPCEAIPGRRGTGAGLRLWAFPGPARTLWSCSDRPDRRRGPAAGAAHGEHPAIEAQPGPDTPPCTSAPSPRSSRTSRRAA